MNEALREEILRLGPWHHDIEVVPGIRTGEPPTDPKVSMLGDGWRQAVMARLQAVYPNGLEGRSVLDCGCNCAECLLWSKEYGAGDCFGFDVREHWIAQARFLLKHYQGPTDGIRVETCGLYDVPKLGLKPFDVTFFNGVFYHLSDPIHGLRIAADLTRETMFFHTATKARMPDGLLVMSQEDPDELLFGVEQLNWYPTGPRVVSQVLKHCGFSETHLESWVEEFPQTEGFGRLEIVASKVPGLLTGLADTGAA